MSDENAVMRLGSSIALEVFADSTDIELATARRREGARRQQDRDEAYQLGFEKGIEEGRRREREDADSEIAQACAAAALAQAAARGREADIADALAVAAVAQQDGLANAARIAAQAAAYAVMGLAPQIAERGFAAEVEAAVEKWARAVGETEGVLFLSPRASAEMAEAIRDTLSARGVAVTVQQDGCLNKCAARFEWRRGFGEIDLKSATEALLLALNAAIEPNEAANSGVQDE
jgi:hypothetical protein